MQAADRRPASIACEGTDFEGAVRVKLSWTARQRVSGTAGPETCIGQADLEYEHRIERWGRRVHIEGEDGKGAFDPRGVRGWPRFQAAEA